MKAGVIRGGRVRWVALTAALAAALLLAPLPGRAEPAAPSPGESAAIPIPEIAARAEETGAALRRLDALLAARADVDAIREKLPETKARLAEDLNETTRALEAEPAPWTLDVLAESWEAERLALARSMELLTKRATSLEVELGRLTEARDRWTLTRAEARNSRAPAPVVERIDAVLAVIATARTRIETERSTALVLQDQVAQALARAEAALASIAGARKGLTGRLFVRDSPPMWRPELYGAAWAGMPERIRDFAAIDLAQVRRFAAERSDRLIVQAAMFAVLILLLRAARRRARAWTSPDERAAAVVAVLDRPIAAALVITLFASFWIYPRDPRTVRAFVGILTIAPVLRVMRPLVDPPTVPWLYTVAGFFFVDRVRSLASAVPVLGHWLFLAETLAAIALLGWVLLRARRRATAEAGGPPPRWVLISTRALLLAGALALAASVFGYQALARMIGVGALRATYLGLVLCAGVRVADGLVGFALRVRPLRLLATVQHHRALLERRAHWALVAVAVVAWLALTLDHFALREPVTAAIRGILGAELARGSLRVSLGDVLAFAVTVCVAFLVSSFVKFLLREDVYPRLHLEPGLPYAMSTLLHYVILFLGFLLAIAALGIDPNKVTILGGAFGIGVGFGLQNVVNNFVSGLIVLFERPVRVGDAVQIGELVGEVRRIGMRSTTVRTIDGAEVIVPNSQLVAEKVTNWTHSDRMRRITVRVGVAYGASPDKVLGLLVDVARAHRDVVSRPAPLALFQGFGDSALNFELNAWTDRFERWAEIKSELGVAVYASLRGADIEIPFPQQDVHIRRDDPRPGAP